MIQQTSETEKRRVSPPRAGALQTGQFFTALVGFLVVIGLLWLESPTRSLPARASLPGEGTGAPRHATPVILPPLLG